MTRRLTDDDLLEAVSRGSEDALRVVIGRYAERIHAVCHRCGLRPNETEDAAAIVAWKIWRYARTVHDPGRLEAWISTITRRAAADQRLLRLDGDDDDAVRAFATDDDELEGVLGRLDAEREVTAVRGALSGRAAAIVEFKLAQPDATNEQIADGLGIPLGSVGPTLARLTARLAADRSPPA